MRTENSRSECTCWRLDFTNEPGRTVSVGQSIFAVIAGGRWLLKNAVACSGWEKIALKKPSLVCAAGVSCSSSGSTRPQNYLTDVGAYGVNSQSAYGTNDQAGNVFEWNDAVISGSSRGLRGGSWGDFSGSLPASGRGSGGPTGEDVLVGFRVASVPEPTSIFLTMFAGGVLLIRRKR